VLARERRGGVAGERDVVMAMDERRKRELYPRAYEVLDRGEEQERVHQEWRDRHDPFELEMAQSDARLEKLRARQLEQKRDDGELIYKTVWNEAPPRQLADEGANGEALLNDLADLVGEALAEMRAELQTKIDLLGTRLDVLSAQLELLKTKAAVIPLRGRNDVA
jgi:hypothetical protein